MRLPLHQAQARTFTTGLALFALLSSLALFAIPVAAQTASPSTNPSSQPSGGGPLSQVAGLPTQWLNDALQNALVHLGQGILDAVQQDVDWAFGSGGQGADFVTQTPASHSYNSAAVTQLFGTIRDAANAALALVAMWAGFQVMSGPQGRRTSSLQSAVEVAPRLVLGATLINTSLFWCQLGIDSANALGGIAGPVDLPARAVASNPAQTIELVVTALVYWLVALLLVLQQLMRLALVDVLIVLAPLGMLLWILPQTQSWGRLWSDLFLTTVFAQPVQMLVLKLGTALVGELDGAGSVESMFLAMGVAYLVLKVPGMLRGGLVRGGGGMGTGAIAAVLSARQVARASGATR